jgi:hypothetical protein
MMSQEQDGGVKKQKLEIRKWKIEIRKDGQSKIEIRNSKLEGKLPT